MERNKYNKYMVESPQYIQYTYQGVLSKSISDTLAARIQAAHNIMNEQTFEFELSNLWIILNPDVKEEVRDALAMDGPFDYILRAEERMRDELKDRIEEIGSKEEECNKEIWGREFCMDEVNKMKNEVQVRLTNARFWAASEVFDKIMEALHEKGWFAELKPLLKGGEK